MTKNDSYKNSYGFGVQNVTALETRLLKSNLVDKSVKKQFGYKINL